MSKEDSDGFEMVPRKGRKLKVMPKLLDWYLEELGWERKDLWKRIVKMDPNGGPDRSSLDKIFSEGWASKKNYFRIRAVLRKELAKRYDTDDKAERIDPERVPLPRRLDKWPKRKKQ